ncbi:MAG: esterase-like activity of phytase family protein, partial [Leucothrix sp.]
SIRAGILLCSMLVLMACGTVANSNSYKARITPEKFTGNRHMNIRLLGSLAISTAPVDSLPVVELSDLAWDADTNTLYAISDNGYLYTIDLKRRNNKLAQAKFLKATRLKGANKKPLKRAFSDSEGLDIINANNNNPNDAELVISFEGNSRADRYNTSGHYLGTIALPKRLQNRRKFRHGNKMLESIVLHPQYGALVAAELPLKASPKKTQSIYSQNGKTWHFPRLDAPESSVTALEVLDNGDVLVLERAWSGFFNPLVISLRQVQLNRCNAKNHCQVRDLAIFNSASGWNVDNFEGLTHLEGNRYLMVSDDNKSPLQQTLLVMFEVLP